MTPPEELRAAVEVLRDPCQCLRHAPLIADLLEAVADDWPSGYVHTSTAPRVVVRQRALALARTLTLTTSEESDR